MHYMRSQTKRTQWALYTWINNTPRWAKVDRLCNRVEPFAALFWDLGIVLANT